MTKVQQQAISDIKDDLEKQDKCFIAFHSELNPVMRKLVHQQIHDQISLAPRMKKKSQLIAHCVFYKSTGTAQLFNYSCYYDKQ